MVLSGSSDSSSSLSFSSCLVTGVGRPGSAAFQEPSHRSQGSKSPDSAPPASARARLSPAGTLGRMRPGTARTWQWWCGNGSSRRARSVACLSGPSSHLRAAAPGCAPPPCAHHLPPPASCLHQRLGGEEAQVCKGGPSRVLGQGQRAGSEAPTHPLPSCSPRL